MTTESQLAADISYQNSPSEPKRIGSWAMSWFEFLRCVFGWLVEEEIKTLNINVNVLFKLFVYTEIDIFLEKAFAHGKFASLFRAGNMAQSCTKCDILGKLSQNDADLRVSGCTS